MSLPASWVGSRAVALFMIFVGSGVAVGGAWFVVESVMFLGATERAEGTVIALQKERGVRGSTLYFPLVRYRHPRVAEDMVFKAKPGLWPSPFSAGDRVTVAYNRTDPADARILSFWTLWFLQGATLALGLGSVLAGRASLRGRR